MNPLLGQFLGPDDVGRLRLLGASNEKKDEKSTLLSYINPAEAR
jgi:hypothetical protein